MTILFDFFMLFDVIRFFVSSQKISGPETSLEIKHSLKPACYQELKRFMANSCIQEIGKLCKTNFLLGHLLKNARSFIHSVLFVTPRASFLLIIRHVVSYLIIFILYPINGIYIYNL